MASVSSAASQKPPVPAPSRGLTLAIRQQEGVDTLPHRAVDEGLAGQGLVQGILQGVAALNLPTGHDVVHQVALRLDVLGSSNLLKVETQWNSPCKQKDIQTEKVSTFRSHTSVLRHTARNNYPQTQTGVCVSCLLGFWLRAFLLPVLQSQAPARLADSAAWSSVHLRARMLGKALPNLSQPVSLLPAIRKQVQPLPSSKQVLHTNSQGPFTVKASIPSPHKLFWPQRTCHSQPQCTPAVLPGMLNPLPPAPELPAPLP